MSPALQVKNGIRLAIEGCGHGTLHSIYASIAEACSRKGWPSVDLLIIGGDFQSVRNAYDLNCVSMPAKYRAMCDFHEYYSGQQKAPYPTIFVGGNHEASNYLFELYYGGWVAPNMYYMGAANVLRFGPLRIAGMSGIWKGYNYRKSHYERLPYSENDIRSIYHVRELDIRKLLQLRSQVDIGISHDWPNGVEKKGNYKQLMRFKPHLEADSESNSLGSVAAHQVMDWLRPRFWFSAHLHCKYAAVVQHAEAPSTTATITRNSDEIDLDEGVTNAAPVQQLTTAQPVPNIKNDDEIELDDEEDSTATPQNSNSTDSALEANGAHNGNWPYKQSLEAATAALPASFHRKPREERIRPVLIKNRATNFLALDKCLPGKQFLQLSEIETDNDIQRPLVLKYDSEWLAITRAFAMAEPLILANPDAPSYPAKQSSEYYGLIDEQKEWVQQHLTEEDMRVPFNFSVTSPVFDGGVWSSSEYRQVAEYPNPQTEQFCRLLQMPNPFAITEEQIAARLAAGPALTDREDEFSHNRRHDNGRGGRGNRRGGFRPQRGRGSQFGARGRGRH